MTINRERLASLTLRDPLAWGISYIDLLEGRKWEVGTRAWVVEIYQELNPWLIEKYPDAYARRLVVTKSTQAGISTTAIVKKFHFATNWPVRVFYTLPRQQDYFDFVTTRIDPMIAASPYLRSKLGLPNSVHAKRIGNSYIFYMELTVEPRMMPADILFVDEVDLSNPDYMSTALNRLDASRWKLQMYLSTPTVPNYGIHSLYTSSDQREWLVKCPGCTYEQPIDWETNLRIVGPHNNPTKVFYGCARCNREITVEHIQTGRWVAKKPDLSREIVGFHVHQMLTTPAPVLYAYFRDPQTKLVEFYRKRLGKPYEIGGGSLERDDILAACFDEPYTFENEWDGVSTYYMGVDQGNELQVLVAKVPPGKRRPKIVRIELVPMEKGFNRVAQLMDIYHIRRAVVDGNPNRHEAVSLTNKFPSRVLVADYNEQREVYITKKGRQDKNYVTNVTINRTAGFDALIESIKKGEWQLPGEPPSIHPDVELLIDHVTAIKRDIETRRTASGEVQVAVWRKLRAEHLAHAWLYMHIACQIDLSRGAGFAVIGRTDPTEPEEKQEETYRPDQDTITGIASLLAEVPKDQLKTYLANPNLDKLPFPLSYKYKLVREKGYSETDIRWVMEQLINDRIKRQKYVFTKTN